MLSLFEQHALNELVSDFKDQVIEAFKTKQIKRLSSRNEGGQRIYTEFQAPVNATGNLVRSVRDESTEEGARVYCAAYVDKLIFGQEPERVDELEILKWMKAKGINGGEGVASLISNKIYKEGSSIWLFWKGENSGLLADVDISFSLDKLKGVLTKQYADQVAAKLIEPFKVAA